MSYYYDIAEDIKKYPSAWCYIVFGGRAGGKTYSTLKYVVQNDKKFVFVRRTIEDVNTICMGNKLDTKLKRQGFESVDMSPFKSLNRDLGWRIKAFSMTDGFGAFYNTDEDNNPIDSPIGYVMSLSTTKLKGYDLSECDCIIFDEFVNKSWERRMKKEGEAVMELYKTVSRDRTHRGKEDLKLICLANADNASSALTNTLEVTDMIAEMCSKGQDYFYDQEREIMIHKIVASAEFRAAEENTKIYKAMKGTTWAKTALDNDFGYNDFSNVKKVNMKNYRPVYVFIYNRKRYTAYINPNAEWYITLSGSNQKLPEYDMTKENDQKLWYSEQFFTLYEATREGRAAFEKYTIYEVMLNFKKFFYF